MEESYIGMWYSGKIARPNLERSWGHTGTRLDLLTGFLLSLDTPVLIASRRRHAGKGRLVSGRAIRAACI